MLKKFTLLIVLVFSVSHALITPSRLSFRQQFSPANFTFDLAASTPTGSLAGGEIRAANIDSFQALSGEDISYTLFKLQPCAVNLPHVHPRAAELLYVISGKLLRTGFTEENGGRTIVNDLKSGQVKSNFYRFFFMGINNFNCSIGCDFSKRPNSLPAEFGL